jgi:hypothetical protein
MKYQIIMTFIKRTNLLDFFAHNVEECTSLSGHDPACSTGQLAAREHYAKERDVRLILMVRMDGPRTFCKIKCPINPLPVTGEFEVPNMCVIQHFLKSNGWKKHESLNIPYLMK